MLREPTAAPPPRTSNNAGIGVRLGKTGIHKAYSHGLPPHMSKSTEADRVFTGVVSDILAGVIRPRDRISERDLVARFGVSRTPVREATKRLLERGFVETGPKGVAVVVEIGPEDLRKLYTLRLQLECGAAKQIVANITPQEIDELKQINKRFKAALAQRDLAKMLEIRADFHAVLTGATRNRWLEMILVTLRDKAYMVRHYHWQDFDRAAQTLDIHNQLIKALERSDAAAFTQLVSQQISAAIATYENRLQVPAWTAPRVPEPAARELAPAKAAAARKAAGAKKAARKKVAAA